MKKIIIGTCLLLLIFSIKTNAQREGAIPTLYLNPSPEANGLGWTGVSYADQNALNFYYNPAMLGQFGIKHNFSIQTYPGNLDWLNSGLAKYNNNGLNLGYNFKGLLSDFDLAIGAGYIHSSFNYGQFSPYYSESKDSYSAFGLGFSLSHVITFSAGLTYKTINSLLGAFLNGEDRSPSFEGDAIDYGFCISVPVLKLIKNDFAFKLLNSAVIIPVFNYNIGYSRLNIGNEVYYIDKAQSDPLPLTARLGQAFNIGFNYKTDKLFINLLNYNLILEADDYLIDNTLIVNYSNGDTSSGKNHQGMLGDIKIGKHLIQLKGDDKVVVHKGNSLEFIETVTLLFGSFNGRGYNNVKTDGFIISTNGLFKFLNSQVENQTLKFITNHLELKYANSTLFKGMPIETNFSGVAVSLSNFNFD